MRSLLHGVHEDDLVQEDTHRDVQWQRGLEHESMRAGGGEVRLTEFQYWFSALLTTCGHITEGHRFPFEQRS